MMTDSVRRHRQVLGLEPKVFVLSDSRRGRRWGPRAGGALGTRQLRSLADFGSRSWLRNDSPIASHGTLRLQEVEIAVSLLYSLGEGAPEEAMKGTG